MAVSANIELRDGNFVPYRGLVKGENPEGTLSHRGSATGDATGGAVQIVMRARRLEFGFHPIITLVMVEANDNLAAADQQLFQYNVTPGNERIGLTHALGIRKISIATVSGFRSNWLGEDLPIPIECISETDQAIFLVQWATNTDTKTYNMNMFAMLWDAEKLAKMPGTAHMPEQFFGVR